MRTKEEIIADLEALNIIVDKISTMGDNTDYLYIATDDTTTHIKLLLELEDIPGISVTIKVTDDFHYRKYPFALRQKYEKGDLFAKCLI